MALIRLFSALSAAVLILSSCAADPEALYEFRSSPSSFTVSFPSSEQAVVCDARMDPEGLLRLTVTSPERSAGMTVVCTSDSCTVSAGGVQIPLSADASRAMRDFFLILASETAESVPTRSAEGENTVLETAAGTLVLDSDLNPCAVIYTGMDGEERRAEIGNFSSLINTDNTEHAAE